MSASKEPQETQPYEYNEEEEEEEVQKEVQEEVVQEEELQAPPSPPSAAERAYDEMYMTCESASARNDFVYRAFIDARTNALNRIIEIHRKLRQNREVKKRRLEQVDTWMNQAASNFGDLLTWMQGGEEGDHDSVSGRFEVN